eukprot:8156607-Pyramimonas_sp.AAC.1
MIVRYPPRLSRRSAGSAGSRVRDCPPVAAARGAGSAVRVLWGEPAADSALLRAVRPASLQCVRWGTAPHGVRPGSLRHLPCGARRGARLDQLHHPAHGKAGAVAADVPGPPMGQEGVHHG